METFVRNGRRAQHGLSLVELMIALAIIAIALFAIFSMILHSVSTKDAMRELNLAKEAASAKLEEIKSKAFTDIAGSYAAPNNLFPVDGLANKDFTAGNRRGRGEIAIDSSNSNLYDINVTITWQNPRGAQTYTLRSLYSR